MDDLQHRRAFAARAGLARQNAIVGQALRCESLAGRNRGDSRLAQIRPEQARTDKTVVRRDEKPVYLLV